MTTLADPLSTLFDLSTGDPEARRQRLALLRRPYAEDAQLRPMFVNDLRFGGSATVNVLERRLEAPARRLSNVEFTRRRRVRPRR